MYRNYRLFITIIVYIESLVFYPEICAWHQLEKLLSHPRLPRYFVARMTLP